jgi:chemosensory pili system protein ChpA (sensor histidine kinase/response regulator)
MDIVNENVEVLITKVAELLDILLETFHADRIDGDDTETAVRRLERYARKVGSIAMAAESGAFIGLYNVSMLYQELLVELASCGEAPSEQARILLEEWPTLVIAYLQAPTDPETADALVRSLQSPIWATPLSAEDTELLKELLLQQTTAVSAQREPVNIESATEEYDEPEEAVTALEVAELTIPDFGTELEIPLQAQSEYEGSSSGLETSGDPEQEAAGDLKETLASEQDETDVGELDETAKELINLLYLEVAQLASSLEEALTGTEAEGWCQLLEDHAEELERLGEGAEAMGLEGLQQVSVRIRENLLNLVAQEQPLSDDQRQIVSVWPVPILSYLQGLHESGSRVALVQYLQDSRWLQPLSQGDGTALIEALAVTSLDLGEEEQESRQRHARLEDISLMPPEDVNPELLDSLLQEMPLQAADFSAAIQRLTSGEGTRADVEAAQRVAHTLKGAANTVGVPGVANLTHHLEDILLALAQHDSLPTQALNQILINAADCLEAMSETLVGMSEPPSEKEILGVLQAVLDWANLIDHEGIPSDTTHPEPREVLPGLAKQATTTATETPQRTETAQQKVINIGSGTRVPADLVDELLRQAGEAMILNGQLYDRLERTVQQMRSVRAQNTVLQQLVLELEHLVNIRGITSPLLHRTMEGEFDPLEMEQYNELHTVSRRLFEAVTDTREMNQEVEFSLVTLNGLLTDQHKVQRENEETIMRTRMVPVNTIASRLQRSVRQACRLTGKEAALVLSGGETLIDSNVLGSMVDPLMHLLRNAVDHGIEWPEERELIGKPKTGNIALDFTREGNTIVMRCRDDGAGMDFANIRHTALERGLIRDNQLLSEEELGRLTLQPGFSTRSQTTQVSGRGIGMGAVYNRVQELKGSLHIQSEANQGCQIELRLPVTLMSTHGLLVRAGEEVLAVSDRGVEQILYPGMGKPGQMGSKSTYQIGEEVFEASTLAALLRLPPDRRHEQRISYPALLVREESDRRRVVFVQEVMDSLALVVKNLGRYIPAIKGIVGATILGDGSVAPVLDLPDLLRSPARGYAGPVAREEAVSTADMTAPVALVVDDSLSARRALADFVKDLGFEVRTAGDGLEAVAIIDHKVPDILLVDLEMPRMNGLELTSHVRSRDDAAHLPVIMITSRSTEKHRQSAAQAGVDAYLIKPFADDELASHIQQLTAHRGVA